MCSHDKAKQSVGSLIPAADVCKILHQSLKATLVMLHIGVSFQELVFDLLINRVIAELACVDACRSHSW